MSRSDRRGAPASPRQPLRTVIHDCGVAILLGGLIGAVLIYVFADTDGAPDSAREIVSGRMYQHNVELMGGKFAVYADQFSQWFAGLWQGRSLAFTVATLTVAIALACFGVARLMSGPLPHESDGGPEADHVL